ncbi:MAG: phenylalanine--tRNA ligase subunit beta [Bacteroidetes bacterium]|nr:phenylalanine--tRNA ligase subunit beta [Bacteroidota bacterium]
MRISYNWLKKYVDTDMSAEEMAVVLTDIGLEVEAVEMEETIKGGLAGVFVGQVMTCVKHPDADKLHITTIECGGDPIQIVCGAPNVREGLKVMVATVGCKLYPEPEKPFKISKSKIRGVESFGMLCAEDELGFGGSHEGIMELPENAIVGTPAKEFLGVEEEYFFEIGLTPNRVDGASHMGVARDLVAYLRYKGKDCSLKLAGVTDFKEGDDTRKTDVIVEATEACSHYMGLTITGAEVKPSEEWLKKALISIGINPKNNVVDITNFILHELGQPLHAFDADVISGGKVVVRKALEGEKLTTLDDVERKLCTEDLVICDDQKPMCLAGVMGGKNSGVTEKTTSIFIESAYFNSVSIRKSAKRQGLNTDASFRYERGTDPNILDYALRRASLLICKMTGGKVSSKIIDIENSKVSPFAVELSIEKTERLIGKNLGVDTIKSIIKALDIEIIAENDGVLSLLVPPYRVDVQRDVDVIEDILRIYGYNNIEVPESVKSTLAYAPSPDRDNIQNTLANFLSSNGLNEIMSNSLTKVSYYEGLEEFPEERCVKILNPLSNDLNVMRQTLMFNALEAVILNTNRKNGDLKIYEFGNTYNVNPKLREEGAGAKAYYEVAHLSIAVTGAENSGSWNAKYAGSSFYTLKNICDKMLRRFGLNINEAIYSSCESELYSSAVTLKLRGKSLITLGAVSKTIRKKFDIKAEVYYADLNFDVFVEMIKNNGVTVKEISKFPEVSRDLSLLIDKSVTFSQLRSVAFKTEKKLLKNVTLFDVYEGDKLPEGKKSYALNFILEDVTKTLTDKVIDATMGKFIHQLEKNANAEVRK